MYYRVILIVTLMLTAGAAPVAAPAASKGIEGLWFSKGERSRIEIAPCGDKLCGVIVWLKEPNDENGQPLRDILNTDDTVKGRPILGMPVLTELQADGKAVIAFGCRGPGGFAQNFALVRINADGSPDMTFGEGGKVVLGGSYDGATDVAIQPDGKIVAIGGTTNTTLPVSKVCLLPYFRSLRCA